MRNTIVGIAVFVAAAAVLVLEIVAGRILAPYVGVSLQSFTGIIGTILAAIALGAWAGGRLADRRDPSSLLGPVLIVGGILAVVSPALVYIVGPSASGESPSAIVLLAAVGFFLPAAVLSMVTPIAAKLSLSALAETGSVVGSLSAIGTAGALFGTFVTGFVLIAAMPSQPITWVTGAILVALGGVFSWRASGIAAAIIGAAALLVAVTGSASVAAPCDYETAYSCAIIADRNEGPTTKALILDTFVNSVVDVEDPTYLSSRYAKVTDAVVRAQVGEPRSVVYVGGGGYTLPRYYHAVSGSLAVVLEIDGVLPEIAVDELGLEPGPWLKTITGDARLTLRDLADGQFDVAVGDAFSGRSVPWHLTTVEFMEDIERKLVPGGVYVVNTIDHPPSAFSRAKLATMAEVFDHVAVVAPEAYLDGERGGNIVLVGANLPIDADTIASLVPGDEKVLVDTDAVAWTDGARALTDDYAPADQLLSRP